MSEKKWSCKWTSSGRRGRSHIGKEYPRHALQYYEGTHLGMRKRIYSKSQAGTVWRKGRPCLSRKYIIGLLNKFVGKTYEDFKYIFDQKTKNLFKKYSIPWCKLEDFLHDSSKESYWHDEFYVDDKGFIRKCKRSKRNPYRSILKKKHIKYNSRVKTPDWGAIRSDFKWAANRTYSTVFGKPMPPQYREPLLLGEFFVKIGMSVYKLPVYTCNQDLFVTYYYYREESWDTKLREYVKTPFWKSNNYPEKYTEEKKRFALAHNWMKVEVFGMKYSQDYWVRADNIDRKDCLKRITNLKTQIEKSTDLIEKRQLQDNLNYYEGKLEKYPQIALYNMGYGRYYTFVKVCDFEKLKK